MYKGPHHKPTVYCINKLLYEINTPRIRSKALPFDHGLSDIKDFREKKIYSTKYRFSAKKCTIKLSARLQQTSTRKRWLLITTKVVHYNPAEFPKETF